LEALCDLLFELSNDDRLAILYQLMDGPKKLSNMSKTLDLQPQAVSRNLTRLVEIGLIRRNEASEYELTPYGASSLIQLESFSFLSDNKDYMSTHWTDKLPSEFQGRLRDLKNCELVYDSLDMLSNMERVFEEAEEWYKYITPSRIASHANLQFAIQQLDRGVTIQAMEPLDYTLSEKSLARIPKEDLEAMLDHQVKGNLEYRYLDEINLKIYMSEKEVAILSLPKTDGEVDNMGFISSDARFHQWCSDLFDYYWGRGITKSTSWLQEALG